MITSYVGFNIIMNSQNKTSGKSEIGEVGQTSIQSLVLATESATVDNSEKEVVKREIKLGIVVEDYANKAGVIPGYEKGLNKSFSSVSIYKQFGHPTNKTLVLEDLQYLKSRSMKLVVAWEPWNPSEGMNQSTDYLAEIPKGTLDSYLEEFGSSIKNYEKLVIIRFGHEMNGNWYPWGRRPEEYKIAYRYVVDFFKKQGVGNAKFMWSINAESVPIEPIGNVKNYYPGDAYVDFIGLDGFNYGQGGGRSWRSFDQIFSSVYTFVTSAYPEKQVMISETASGEEGGDKAAWVRDMYMSLGTKYRKVDEVIWFNLIKERDWRVDSTDSSFAAFKDVYTP